MDSDTIPFYTISEELKSQYPNLDHFGYAIFNYKDYNKKGKTVMPTFIITWKNKSRSSANVRLQSQDEERIKSYLKARLKLDTLQLLKE